MNRWIRSRRHSHLFRFTGSLGSRLFESTHYQLMLRECTGPIVPCAPQRFQMPDYQVHTLHPFLSFLSWLMRMQPCIKSTPPFALVGAMEKSPFFPARYGSPENNWCWKRSLGRDTPEQNDPVYGPFVDGRGKNKKQARPAQNSERKYHQYRLHLCAHTGVTTDILRSRTMMPRSHDVICSRIGTKHMQNGRSGI